jgi:shikimate dehydrogenase
VIEMPVSGKTKICAIIGDPVEHTMSPAMQNTAFKKTGLDYLYIPFSVKPENLAKAVAGLRALNVIGFNVTIPHKIAVLKLLDSLDPLAEKIGAVNTVVNTGGKLRGYNTDAEGFYQALQENGINPEGKNVTILGAGGASRAIAYILAEKGARLTIINRQAQLEKAENIAVMIKKNLKTTVKVLGYSRLADGLRDVAILVNATSVGMSPRTGESPVPAGSLKKVPVVFDIVYNPLETRLLKSAKTAGAVTIGGMDMLVWQGAMAFEKWTGQKAPVAAMRNAAVKMLDKV